MRLHLIRHGQTPANVIGSLDTERPGPGLTDVGHIEAAALVERFDGIGIDLMAVSTLVRTTLTAAPLAADRGIAPIVRDGLREIEAGALEKRTDLPSAARYIEIVQGWALGGVDERMPGAESGTEVFERFDRVVAELHGDGVDRAAVVSHGAMIRAWVAGRAQDLDAAALRDRPLANTGVLTLEGAPGEGWRLLGWSNGGEEPIPR